jgi:peptide deformylase
MAILPIVRYGNLILKKKSKPIKNIDEGIIKLANDMAETMYHNHGIGLAAVQVGVLKNLIIIGETSKNLNGYIPLINPEIIWSEGESIDEESCLSLIEIKGLVKRAKEVGVKAVTIEGKEIEIEAKDLFARVLQHEIDHLHGILFIDKMEEADKKAISKELKRIRKETQRQLKTLKKEE